MALPPQAEFAPPGGTNVVKTPVDFQFPRFDNDEVQSFCNEQTPT
jgi:hypothetical protein